MALSLTYRLTKGSPLTSAEHDANLHELATGAEGLDAANAKLGVGSTSLLQTIYPVGAIYISTLATNPNTLLGFGTWTAYGAGRVLVGLGSSPFDALGNTGGAETHTLVSGEMPAHTHVQDSHTHGPATSGGTPIDFMYTAVVGTGGAGLTAGTNITSSPTTAATTAVNQNTGGGGAHNNLQPYVTVAMWLRTA
jgi:hypothetical protein